MRGLWVVPTPIGNLEDITLRALARLREADVIWCEDTRQSQKLLQHYEIRKPLRPLHVFNEHERVGRLFDEAAAHHWAVALITDSGTPGISDPGYLAIQEALRRQVPIEVLPGPAAFVVALVGSGLPLHKFAFEGFFPRKGQQKYLQKLQTEERTLIWYESPHRLVKTLGLLKESLGPNRLSCIARELTKQHESYHRGTLETLHAYFLANPPRGECVLLVAGPQYALSPPQ
jgi:16S rRNA (cytidine1402-2'-O)-methyltransferase